MKIFSLFYGLIFVAFSLGIILTNLLNWKVIEGIAFGIFGFILLIIGALNEKTRI